MWLNGWRRLWLAATVLAVLVAITCSFYLVSTHGRLSYDYRAGLAKDFANADCQEYATRPLAELEDPLEELGACSHLYTSRKIDAARWGDTTPYTQEVVDANERKQKWREFAFLVAIFGGGAVVLSLLVYLAGSVIAWIVRGFRAQP